MLGFLKQRVLTASELLFCIAPFQRKLQPNIDRTVGKRNLPHVLYPIPYLDVHEACKYS